MNINRPLKALSDFVAEKLKGLLASNPIALCETVAALVSVLTEDDIELARNTNQGLALLDVKMCEAAIVHSGNTSQLPARLLEINQQLCPVDYVPVVTYHDLILVNPASDMRLFTCDGVGETERFFYTSHQRFEAVLETILATVLEEMATASAQTADGSSLTELVKIASGLGRMTPGHFDQFRMYLMKMPNRNFDGPSGAFTWRIQLLEILMWSDWLPADYQEEIVRKMFYFPQEGKTRIREAQALVGGQGAYKDLVLRTKSEALYNRLCGLAKVMQGFRHAHIGATRKQLPEVAKDQAPGTRGIAHAGSYLNQRRDAMGELGTRLEREFNGG